MPAAKDHYIATGTLTTDEWLLRLVQW